MKRRDLVFAVLVCAVGMWGWGTVAIAQDGPTIPGIDALQPLPDSPQSPDDYAHPSMRRTRQPQPPKPAVKPDAFEEEPNKPAVNRNRARSTPTREDATERRTESNRDLSPWRQSKPAPDRTDAKEIPGSRAFTNRGQDLKASARNVQSPTQQSNRDLPSNRRNGFSPQVTPNPYRSQAEAAADRKSNSQWNAPAQRNPQARDNKAPPKTGGPWRKNSPGTKPESASKYPAAKAKTKPATGLR